MYFELTSPLHFYRTSEQGEAPSLGVFFGRDHLDQANLPFYHRGGRGVDIRLWGWVLAWSVMGGPYPADDEDESTPWPSTWLEVERLAREEEEVEKELRGAMRSKRVQSR